ncbi:MAG: hypothetical protein OEZ43_03380 [Gammaproteobacteria bacterium]|nr:hypothetical protein [Gammaproteobacteria bacterium]
MKGLLFLVVIIPFALLLVSECTQSVKETPEHLKTEQEKVTTLLKDFTFNTPGNIDVLLHRDQVDNKTRERVKTIVLKTNVEYLPKTPRITDKASEVLAILQQTLPEQDFGQAVNDEGSFFRMMTANSEWFVYTVETTSGHYSRWERRADVYQATSDQ